MILDKQARVNEIRKRLKKVYPQPVVELDYTTPFELLVASLLAAPAGVFDLTDERLRDDVLANTDIIDIWGINKRTAKKLQLIGIFSARDLRDMALRAGRKLLTVVGARMIEELRGTSSLSLELLTPRKKTICCSRSFSGEVKRFEKWPIHLSTFFHRPRRRCDSG